MTRRDLFRTGIALLGAPSVPRTAASAGSRRPNILLILPDQLRAQALGYMRDPNVKSPHIDRLASQGLVFHNAIANTPVCCPARANLLTGRYAHRNGMVANDLRLRESEATLPQILHDAGYRTGFIGKWHLDGGPRMPGFIPPGPRRHGFEFWAANECSHTHFNTQYFRDSPEPIPMRKFEAEGWTDLALEFLRAQDPRPFFLTVQMGPPHDPYRAPPEYSRLYNPSTLKLRANYNPAATTITRAMIAEYYGMVTAVDDQIGRMMRELDQLGLAKDTIVVLTSDHGDMLGSHGQRLKRKPWDESIRVPGIIRYPRVSPQGRTTSAIFTHVDFAPTMLGLCGIHIPAAMQGADLSGVVTGKTKQGPDEAFLQIFGPFQGDGTEAGWRGIRTRRYTYARYRDKPWVLFDNETDPDQQQNLIGDTALVAQLEKRLNAWMRRTGDSWDNNWTYPVEDAGRLYSKETFYTVDEYLRSQGGAPEPHALDISGPQGQRTERRAVIFYATTGIPSHVFVAFEREDEKVRRSRASAYGFYPAPEVSTAGAALRRVRGVVKDDILDTHALPRAEQTLVVYVNPRQWSAAQSAMEKWRCNGSYRLLKQDCVTFTEEVARALALRVPPRRWLLTRPADWLSRLREIN